MTTALQIITDTAKLIGAIRKGEALAADEAADGLISLNDMLSSWANDGLLVPYRTWENFSISAASSYSIGSGQTLNTVKPLDIKSAFIRSSAIDYYIDPLLDEQYERIPDKSTTSPFPDYFNYDNGHPYGVLRFYPQLSASAALYLLTEKPLTSFASLSTTVDLPPGWNRALKYNLAPEIEPQYGGGVSDSVMRIAAQSLSAVQLAVAKNRPLRFLQSRPMQPNIYSG